MSGRSVEYRVALARERRAARREARRLRLEERARVLEVQAKATVAGARASTTAQGGATRRGKGVRSATGTRRTQLVARARLLAEEDALLARRTAGRRGSVRRGVVAIEAALASDDTLDLERTARELARFDDLIESEAEHADLADEVRGAFEVALGDGSIHVDTSQPESADHIALSTPGGRIDVELLPDEDGTLSLVFHVEQANLPELVDSAGRTLGQCAAEESVVEKLVTEIENHGIRRVTTPRREKLRAAAATKAGGARR